MKEYYVRTVDGSFVVEDVEKIRIDDDTSTVEFYDAELRPLAVVPIHRLNYFLINE